MVRELEFGRAHVDGRQRDDVLGHALDRARHGASRGPLRESAHPTDMHVAEGCGAHVTRRFQSKEARVDRALAHLAPAGIHLGGSTLCECEQRHRSGLAQPRTALGRCLRRGGLVGADGLIGVVRGQHRDRVQSKARGRRRDAGDAHEHVHRLAAAQVATLPLVGSEDEARLHAHRGRREEIKAHRDLLCRLAARRRVACDRKQGVLAGRVRAQRDRHGVRGRGRHARECERGGERLAFGSEQLWKEECRGARCGQQRRRVEPRAKRARRRKRRGEDSDHRSGCSGGRHVAAAARTAGRGERRKGRRRRWRRGAASGRGDGGHRDQGGGCLGGFGEEPI
ncbi:hypothetical protein Ctob_005694 [Chrysochromulina tobinii]|uniref:Uncharacterized protein n=1 Tax=Chrysochromulina tobinii TaxID=1460289 RepID=A0A0M0JG10_9EUKA|nr:hypothetical protein Ctob_005694 [Chrysochromulina tobinii]|eukprot:KOO25521.1 hypothetical protein Ctob_005694 [Chrysochromulina sp. CCMP291]